MLWRFVVAISGVCIPCCLSDVQLSSNVILEPYDLLFDTAVEAYYKGDWMTVILNMERALRNKAAIRRVKAHCRITCANQSAFGEPLSSMVVPVPGAGSVEDLGFFQKIMKRADCVNTCESEKIGPPTIHKVTEDVDLEFKKRTPYNYLQVAYFKINKLDKAVAAANTFFLANPDHMEMKQNLDYYRMMAGVQQEDFKDLEARPHMAEFLAGKRYYSSDSFGLAIDHFEAAVEEYFSADQECRALCEGAYVYDGYNYMEYSADLFQSMTDHYMQILNCKQKCSVELASTAGKDKPFEDFLPSHFNYLQFSYYNSEKYEQAIEWAKTYLLFHPEEEVMNQNLAYYSAVLGEDKAAAISARLVVKQHIQQSLLEKELLYFAYEVFGITFVDPDSWTPADVMPLKLREKQKAERETAARITEEIGNLMKEIETLVEEKNKESTDIAKIVREGGPLLFDDIKITMSSKQLNGSQRVLLDGFISNDECRELTRLSNAAALNGDGYQGHPSPHSPSESFQGVTVLKAIKLGQEGTVPLKSARLFFDMSEKVRGVLESYFRLDSPLYFSYSHLVCRSAIDEKQDDRDNLSHPVHADNCLLVSELNECIKEPPAYTNRDYSAILYLNDDFEGGDFIFTELDAKTVTAEVRPQCGRVVGFGAGNENPHGVRAVTKGQRCAVALWFTLDPKHEEKDRIQAQEMLKMFSSPTDTEFTNTKAESSQPQLTPLDQSALLGQAATLVQEQAYQPEDKPAEKKPEEPAEKKPEEPAEKKPKEPAEKNPEEPAETVSEKPSDYPEDKKNEKPIEKHAEKLIAKKGNKAKVKELVKTKAKAATTKTAANAGDKANAKTADKAKAGDKANAKTADKAKAGDKANAKTADKANAGDKANAKTADKAKAGDKANAKTADKANAGDKANAKTADKAKAGDKANAKTADKAKAGDKANAKTADKDKAKPAAKTNVKQAADNKEQKPATKKTEKIPVKKVSKDSKTDLKSSSDSQTDKDEL
ncbi:prolyl 3-hydroxylase 1-like isoform X2 [Oncorhynchus keta]|uniref:prolyl 3-hydroxylase 1-like isoform X2 n=1 Tax=Oncorhynchus keta TaxID=8018 RepID=UPI00227B47B7|nr:prolyl 3-hydroxylase 1-like isoform X2 [Oncorhynchus keta]